MVKKFLAVHFNEWNCENRGEQEAMACFANELAEHLNFAPISLRRAGRLELYMGWAGGTDKYREVEFRKRFSLREIADEVLFDSSLTETPKEFIHPEDLIGGLALLEAWAKEFERQAKRLRKVVAENIPK